MIETMTPKQAYYRVNPRISELRTAWMGHYPTSVDQSLYNLVMNLLDSLQTAVRLAGEVQE